MTLAYISYYVIWSAETNNRAVKQVSLKKSKKKKKEKKVSLRKIWSSLTYYFFVLLSMFCEMVDIGLWSV